MRHGKSHFVVFLALKSPGPYHRYFKLWQREPGFLPRLGQFSVARPQSYAAFFKLRQNGS